MVKDFYKGYKRKKTRLRKIEEKNSLRLAIFYILLSIVLVLSMIFLGIPTLIKLAVFIANLRSSSEPIEVGDNLPPPVPILQSLPSATNSATISLWGFAEVGSRVRIIFNGEEYKDLTADTEGEFVLNDMRLKLGLNRIKAKSIDKSSNESGYSSVIRVLYDNQAPELEIYQPEDGSEFFDTDDSIRVVGATDSDAQIYINERFAHVDSEGNFALEVKLKEGENTIKVEAFDKAGNRNTKEIKVNYSR